VCPSRSQTGTASGGEHCWFREHSQRRSESLTRCDCAPTRTLLLAEVLFVHLSYFLKRRPLAPRRRTLAPHLALERLETRDLLAVNLQSQFGGLTGTAANEPPDTSAAAGPDVVVEVINGPASNHATVAYYDKNTGARLFQQDLVTFFR